jgi:hypothetical protein
MVESVQVTAPPPLAAALKTAKLEALPSWGAPCANAAWLSSDSKQTEKYF